MVFVGVPFLLPTILLTSSIFPLLGLWHSDFFFFTNFLTRKLFRFVFTNCRKNSKPRDDAIVIISFMASEQHAQVSWNSKFKLHKFDYFCPLPQGEQLVCCIKFCDCVNFTTFLLYDVPILWMPKIPFTFYCFFDCYFASLIFSFFILLFPFFAPSLSSLLSLSLSLFLFVWLFVFLLPF